MSVLCEEKLQMVTVSSDGESATLPCLILGLRKSAGGDLELLVLGKSKEPLIKVPVKAIAASQELPLEMTAERENDCGRITVRILGKYEANFAVTDPERY